MKVMAGAEVVTATFGVVVIPVMALSNTLHGSDNANYSKLNSQPVSAGTEAPYESCTKSSSKLNNSRTNLSKNLIFKANRYQI